MGDFIRPENMKTRLIALMGANYRVVRTAGEDILTTIMAVLLPFYF